MAVVLSSSEDDHPTFCERLSKGSDQSLSSGS